MMDAGGHIRPGWSTTSLNNYREFQDYFGNPGETLLALCMAYPHLSSGLQAEVRTYLTDDFLPDYFSPTMYARMGWSEGVARESPPLYPEVEANRTPATKTTNDVPAFSWSYPPQNFYAMYVCARNISELDEVALYNLAKGKLRVPANITEESTVLADDPFEHNAWLTGYIGFLLLQDLAGMSATDATIRNNVIAERDRLLALRWTLFDKDSPWEEREITYKKGMDLARNFLYICPELGQYYRDNILADVEEALDEYDYVTPFWFVGRYEAYYGENCLQPLYALPALLQAKAWILQEDRTELYKHLDAPSWMRGDLFYIQNLVTVIEATES